MTLNWNSLTTLSIIFLKDYLNSNGTSDQFMHARYMYIYTQIMVYTYYRKIHKMSKANTKYCIKLVGLNENASDNAYSLAYVLPQFQKSTGDFESSIALMVVE